MVKNPPVNVGNRRDVGWIPGSGRSPGGAHGNPLQCSCLENPTDRGAWRATAHRAAKESDMAEHTGHTSGQPRLSGTGYGVQFCHLFPDSELARDSLSGPSQSLSG